MSMTIIAIFFVFLIFLPILIVYLIGLWKMFKKAGRNGWEVIIPFYNSWVSVEIAGLNWWYFLFIISSSIVVLVDLDEFSSLCSIASLVAMFFCNYNIAKKFHKDVVFAILMTIFPYVMIPIIGFGKNFIWDNSVLVSANGPINDGKTNSQSTNYNNSNGTNQSNYNFQNNTNNYSSSSKKFCANCGNEITMDIKYCPKCGSEIK